MIGDEDEVRPASQQTIAAVRGSHSESSGSASELCAGRSGSRIASPLGVFLNAACLSP